MQTSLPDQIDLPELPVAFMNADHRHAVEQWRDLIQALASYPDDSASLLQAWEAFIAHNRDHFQREEEAMRATGFPPYPVHKQEHDRVLDWLAAVGEAMQAGDQAGLIGQVIRQDLPQWLVQHIQTMDAVTARWIATHG